MCIIMQVEFNVVFLPGEWSMRKAIWDDRDNYLEDWGLEVTKFKDPRTTIKASDRTLSTKGGKVFGSINVLWDQKTKMLMCHGNARNDNTPYELIGLFMGYMLEFSHFNKIGIRVVNIFPETI